MADAPATSTPNPAAQNRVYNCPNCGAGLRSPYHTICPVCAEPIDTETIQHALGARIELAGGAAAQINAKGIMLGAIAAIFIIAAFMLLVFR